MNALYSVPRVYGVSAHSTPYRVLGYQGELLILSLYRVLRARVAPSYYKKNTLYLRGGYQGV